MKSRICDMIGIEYPIIQGGMAWVANPALASAVSNAGGLGIVACGHAPGDVVNGIHRRDGTFNRQTIWCKYYAIKSICG